MSPLKSLCATVLLSVVVIAAPVVVSNTNIGALIASQTPSQAPGPYLLLRQPPIAFPLSSPTTSVSTTTRFVPSTTTFFLTSIPTPLTNSDTAYFNTRTVLPVSHPSSPPTSPYPSEGSPTPSPTDRRGTRRTSSPEMPSTTASACAFGAGRLYTAAIGDTCWDMSASSGISQGLFMIWNPQVKECSTDVFPGSTYCVGLYTIVVPVSSLATYLTTAPESTSSAAAGSSAVVIIPIPTCNCLSCYEAVEGDTSSTIAAAHGITVGQFLSWNPSIKDVNAIWAGTDYCVDV